MPDTSEWSVEKKLTKAIIDAAVIPHGLSEFRLRDTKVRGLIVRIRPGAKTYALTLGSCFGLTLDDTREAANNALTLVALGQDPASARR
jgi:hypothetical protein